jgi:hypothetical protein
MQLDFDDAEAAALTQALDAIVTNARYPFSPRIRVLRAFLVKLGEMHQLKNLGAKAPKFPRMN